jgi:hypothetical protein
MITLGIPPKMVRWYHNFLEDRKNRVLFNGEKSKSVRFGLGVPQGSVSGPILFDILMTTLSERLQSLNVELREEELPPITQIEFADDNTLYVSGPKVVQLGQVMQRGLNVVSQWGKDFGMSFANSTEAVLFTTCRMDFDTERTEGNIMFPKGVELSIGEVHVPFLKMVRLLGIRIDNELIFTKHVKYLRRECSRRVVQLSKMTSGPWGLKPKAAINIYKGYILQLLTYGAPIWSNFLTETLVKRLGAVHHSGLRVSLGVTRSTRLTALYRESGIPPLNVLFDMAKAITSERYNRYTEGCTLKDMASINSGNPRIKKGIPWNCGAEKILASVGLDMRREKLNRHGERVVPNAVYASLDISCRDPLLNHSALAPWICSFMDRITFNWQLPTDQKKEELTEEDQRVISETQVQSLGYFDVTLSSDGTVNDEGTTHVFPVGAAASVVTYWDGTSVERLVAAGNLAHSLQAEKKGFSDGFTFMVNRIDGPILPQNAKLLVVTDSQSLIRLLQSGPYNVKSNADRGMWWQLQKWLTSGENNTREIVFQHVFSHCGVAINEKVDELAETAAGEQEIKAKQAEVPIPFSNVVSVFKLAYVKKYFKDLTTDVSGARDKCFSKWHPGTTFHDLPRFQQSFLTQLRCGECPLMGGYRAKVAGIGAQVCRWCRNRPETVEHVFAECNDIRIRQLRLDNLVLTEEEKKIGPGGSRLPLKVMMHPHRANDVVEFTIMALKLLNIEGSELQVARDMHNARMGQV